MYRNEFLECCDCGDGGDGIPDTVWMVMRRRRSVDTSSEKAKYLFHRVSPIL
jgi:hypothetical protein